MKIKQFFLLITTLLFIPGCFFDKNKNYDVLVFATSAEYPPFEYCIDGMIQGFDIDLAHALGQELGKKIIFKNMQFSSILAAVQSGMVDAAIATMTITSARLKNFDFSDPYYVENIAILFKEDTPIKDVSELVKKIIGCQLGTTMESWLKQNYPTTQIIAFDNNNQAIEALKVGYVEGVLIDKIQGALFSQKNPGLSYVILAAADNGYGVAFSKGSPLKDEINIALKKLQNNGTIQKLQDKWLMGNV